MPVANRTGPPRQTAQLPKVHIGSNSPTWNTWRSMLQRIRDPNHCSAHIYFGMSCDPRWHDYMTFRADMGPRPPGMSIDRIDGTKGYWPDNCRWATPAQQNANQLPRTRKHKSRRLSEKYELASVADDVFI